MLYSVITWLNVLPAEYLYPLIGVIVVISLFIVPVMYSKNGKKNRKKIAAFFAVLFMVLFGIGTYYIDVYKRQPLRRPGRKTGGRMY